MTHIRLKLDKPTRIKRLRNGRLHRQRFVRDRCQFTHGPRYRLTGEWSFDESESPRRLRGEWWFDESEPTCTYPVHLVTEDQRRAYDEAVWAEITRVFDKIHRRDDGRLYPIPRETVERVLAEASPLGDCRPAQ